MVDENQATNPEAEAPAPEGAEDVAALKQALAEATAKAEANLAGWQRAQADLVNSRRRADLEKEETSQFANSALVQALLPVLDDIERAFAFIPDEIAEVKWLDGIRLIERKLRGILEAQGLGTIKAKGEPFDPNQHEGVMQVPGKEGIVQEELQKGYGFRGRVIRPAKVAVGNGEKPKKTQDKED
jgi:molecular chaperone GrpE